MTVVDGFSKWAMAVALPSKKQEIVSEALVSRVFIMGWPDRLLTDRGKEFTNRVLNQCLKLCGSRHVTTTAYHPQGNAYAERIHRFFRHAVTAYVRDDQRNWDELLPGLLTAYNDATHEATGYTPSEILFGRRLNAPGIVPPKPKGDYSRDMLKG